MDFWKTIVSLAKRRYVGPPVLVLSILVAALAFLLVPTRYTSSATMVLTTPPSGGVLSQDPNRPTGLTNPLLQFGEGLKTTAGILIQVMNTPDTQAAVGAPQRGPTTITVDNGSSNPSLFGVEGPFVYIQGESLTADAAHQVVVNAQQHARDELVARQKALNAPPSTYIMMVDVVSVSAPETVLAGKWRAAGIGFAACVLLGLGGAYVAQRLLASRRGKPDAPEPAEEGPTPVEPPTVRFAPVPQPHPHPVPTPSPKGVLTPASNGNPAQVNGKNAPTKPTPSPRS